MGKTSGANKREKAKTEIYVEQKMEVEKDPLYRDILELVSYNRPKCRADCRNIKRPCPFVSCKYHLFLDVNPETKSIKFNFPDKKVEELRETCALDVADKGGVTLEEVGAIMNLTRERIRQVEMKALIKLRQNTTKYNITNFSFPSDK